MKIEVSKLAIDTVIDLVKTVYSGAKVKEKPIHIHGGAPRTEFTIYSGEIRISPTTNSPDKAWRYCLEAIERGKLHEFRIQLCVATKLIVQEDNLPEFDVEDDLRDNDGKITMFRESLAKDEIWMDTIWIGVPCTHAEAEAILQSVSHRASYERDGLKFRLIELPNG